MAAVTNIDAIMAVLQDIEPQDPLGGSVQCLSNTYTRYKTIDRPKMAGEARDAYERRFLMTILTFFGHREAIQHLLYDQLYEGLYTECPKLLRQSVLCHLTELQNDMGTWIAKRGVKQESKEMLILYFRTKNGLARSTI